MHIEEFTDLDRLLRELELLATPYESSFSVFRGHSNSDWKLETTFSRYSNVSLPEHKVYAFEHLISEFSLRLTQLGDSSMLDKNRRAKLEYARHCGVPSPLLDFTRSPYVALWFAFNGVRGSIQSNPYVSITVLDWNLLGVGFQRFCEEKELTESIRARTGELPIDWFRWEVSDLFEDGYPELLKFVPFAASWNTRMQRQQECFLYDCLDRHRLGFSNLEDFLCDSAFFQFPREDLLKKFVIPSKLAKQAFERLEMMGITGTYLLGGTEGAASDVYNTYNFQSQTAAWDIETR